MQGLSGLGFKVYSRFKGIRTSPARLGLKNCPGICRAPRGPDSRGCKRVLSVLSTVVSFRK